MECCHLSTQERLAAVFQKSDSFNLGQAYEAVPDVPPHSVRARIYDGLKSGTFRKLARGVFAVECQDDNGGSNTCLLIHGNGRDLSFLPDESIDCIITDHPYQIAGALKGGNRDFASYDLFQYEPEDMAEKFRVLKPGCFLVEFLPEESAENFEYVTRVKQMALNAGFHYYAKVPWVKCGFVANTGRKSKNVEDVIFFTRGAARLLRPDAKKDKAEPGVKHFMRGAAGMLPTAFEYAPPDRYIRVHQAEKPVGLLEAIVKYVTLPGELLLDQFAGSGVLGEACLKLGRDCIMVEKEPGFVKAIASRLGITQVMPGVPEFV